MMSREGRWLISYLWLEHLSVAAEFERETKVEDILKSNCCLWLLCLSCLIHTVHVQLSTEIGNK